MDNGWENALDEINRLQAINTALVEQLKIAVSWIEDLERKNSSHQLAEPKLNDMRAALKLAGE